MAKVSDSKVPYYIGLDCGSSSIGWAVTNEKYQVLRARGKDLLGSRLFNEANTAEKRRLARSSRRRTRRAADRIRLLNLLFSEEMSKIDPEFFLRMKKSFLLEEDKHLVHNSENTLFNDKNYTDKDFHRQFPTIWHLRQTIIKANSNQHFDLRLYYLAIHHILKNRGHFLRPGKFKGAGDFRAIFNDFVLVAENYGFKISDSMSDFVRSVITDKTKKVLDRKNTLQNIFLENPDEDDAFASPKRQKELAALIAGGSATLQKIFDDEDVDEPLKISFAKIDFDEKLPEIDEKTNGRSDLIESAKKIYDYGVLSDLLDGEDFICDAMVKNYELHQKQLKELKLLLKPFPNDYKELFKTTKSDGKSICYNAYIGKAYTEDASGRHKSYNVSQEDINKKIAELIKKHGLETPLLEQAEKGELLPKQKGQAKGTIPEQLHHNELDIILEHLGRDYPSFAKTTNEPEAYNNKLKKIASIHEFRIPYYCGPIVNRNRSPFSWGDEEIKALVRPWNFSELVNLPKRAEKFIDRMANACTYLPTEDVLPKSSLLYQKYMVLNELNNLKIDGYRISDIKLKQKIYERAFLDGEIRGNITAKSLEKWLKNTGLIDQDAILSGTSETKFLPKLSTHLDFKKVISDDYDKIIPANKLEEIIKLITVLSDEPKMLKNKISEILKVYIGNSEKLEQIAKNLSRKKYKDWARFSQIFLTGIKVPYEGTSKSILDMLEETNLNLMELLGSEYDFVSEIEKYNDLNKQPALTLDQKIDNSYCSPAVKRTIRQAFRIIEEIAKVRGAAPARIFLETTREQNDPKKKGYTLNRQKKLKESYNKITKNPEVTAILDELNSNEPRALQRKKLYLYFTQMGRCAYSGERINLEDLETSAYDIDHIYPRSKTKDDSINNNLVLVKAELNRDKTDVYPINTNIRSKMQKAWDFWRRAGLITKEKYERLVRANGFTVEELSQFIARQIVETSQSVKVLRELLAEQYPETKIIFVKAGQVSELRNYLTKGDSRRGLPERLEFCKVRELNDLHHAKDAYLNIVVGNVMYESFTDNPKHFLSKIENQDYSINPHYLWRAESYPHEKLKGWYFQDSLETMSKVMRKNSALITKMPFTNTGIISDLLLVGKSNKTDGILPIRKNLDPKKYGGYNSIKGAYFTLIGYKDLTRKIIQTPIYVKNQATYIFQKYPEAQIIIPKIRFGSLFRLNGNLVTISGRTGESLIFAPADQLYLQPEDAFLLKKVLNVCKKLLSDKDYQIEPEKDFVSKEKNLELFDHLRERLKIYENLPGLGHRITQIIENRHAFANLSLSLQCIAISNLITCFGCNTAVADLSSLIPKASSVGKVIASSNVGTLNEIKLILQSPAGLYEKVIDLKTFQPTPILVSSNTSNADKIKV